MRRTDGAAACEPDATSPGEVLPWWTPHAALAIVAWPAVRSVVEVAGEHRLVVGLLLAVAISPWVVQLVARAMLPTAAYLVPSAGALLVLHTVGPQRDWIGHESANGQMSLMIAVWLVGQMASTSSPAAGVAALAAAAAVIVGRLAADTGFDSTWVWLAGCSVALACGTLVRSLVHVVAELRRTQGQLAKEAVRSERQRIAREVHDVVAHSMTVSTLHVTAARLAVARGDTTGALEALEEAERAGRSSMADLRTSIGLLADDTTTAARDGDDGTPAAPLPTASDLPDLVASWHAAGVVVELDLDLDLDDDLGPVAGLVVYRVVQESLANAARHQPGAASAVEVRSGPGGTAVSVRSRGGRPSETPAAGGGRGIDGMRERVEALGGTLTAGPCGDGWEVRAVVPATRQDTVVEGIA